MNFEEVPEFQKDVKSLKKRVKTLSSDISRVKTRIIKPLYIKGDGMSDEEHGEFRKLFFSGKKATLLSGSRDGLDIIKMRLDTDSYQFNTKLRLVCIVIKEGSTVKLIEVYSKSDKSSVDSRRVKKYLSAQ